MKNHHEQLIALLRRNGEMQVRDINSNMGTVDRNVRRVLNDLQALGVITRMRNKYRLVAAHDSMVRVSGEIAIGHFIDVRRALSRAGLKIELIHRPRDET